MKEIIDKLDFIKMTNFCSMQDNIKRMRRQATEWEEYSQRHIWQRTVKYTKNS